MTHDSARPVSKRGSLSLQHKFRVHLRKKLADIATQATTGEWDMRKFTSRQTAPKHDEIAQLAFSLYESGGRQDGRHIEVWLRAEQELVRHYT